MAAMVGLKINLVVLGMWVSFVFVRSFVASDFPLSSVNSLTFNYSSRRDSLIYIPPSE